MTGDPLKKEVSPEPVNMTSFGGGGVFAYIIKIRISKPDHPGLGWALHPGITVFAKEGRM